MSPMVLLSVVYISRDEISITYTFTYIFTYIFTYTYTFTSIIFRASEFPDPSK
ncbi:hypothetical protein DFLDMN_004934 [Cupriavidus sp. H19C3]